VQIGSEAVPKYCQEKQKKKKYGWKNTMLSKKKLGKTDKKS